LQRFSPALLLLSYFTIFISRLRLARSSSLNIFFFADNISAAAPAIFIRPAASQTTIGNSKAFLFPPKGRKLLLSGHKIDKTVSRLRYG
jgi:hypothetical protein